MSKDKLFKLIIVLFLVVAVVVIWKKGQEFVVVENPDKELKGEAYIKYWDRLNEAYKKDSYGGSTPEETLDLFIDALKADDLELASKYFVVEKQGEMLSDLKMGEGSGGINTWLGIMEEEKIGTFYEYSNTYELTTRDSEITVKFRLNTYTDKWKIYEL